MNCSQISGYIVMSDWCIFECNFVFHNVIFLNIFCQKHFSNVTLALTSTNTDIHAPVRHFQFAPTFRKSHWPLSRRRLAHTGKEREHLWTVPG